jgi:hypothetical protein
MAAFIICPFEPFTTKGDKKKGYEYDRLKNKLQQYVLSIFTNPITLHRFPHLLVLEPELKKM